MTCDCCEVVREYPGYRMYSPACLECGARLIQRIGSLRIAVSEARTRQRTVLRDWMAHGHSEAEIRQLAAGSETPISKPLSKNKSGRR